jgi:hypothetical protein
MPPGDLGTQLLVAVGDGPFALACSPSNSPLHTLALGEWFVYFTSQVL